MTLPPLGCTKVDLDTPALCVDLNVMEKNIRTMAGLCREHQVNWRPHSKCHKSSAVARKLIEAGAIGVTCAKLGEAEVMAAGGVKDILIANLIVGEKKLKRLAALRRVADPVVCLDHLDQARPMSQAMIEDGGQPQKLRVVIEVDIGLERVGTLPGPPTLELAREIAKHPGLQFSGIMGYEGHLLKVENQQEKAALIEESLGFLVQTKELLQSEGLACPIVSCAGTGSLFFSARHAGINEVQAGGGVFMDAMYRNQCQVTQLDFALTVLATVVSRPAADRAIIDAGKKSMHVEYEPALVVGWDHCPDRTTVAVGRDNGPILQPGVSVVRLSAEHGALHLEPAAQNVRIGDRIEVVPGYSDLTMVLHDVMYGFRNGRLEVIWPLEARGRLA